MSNLFQFQGFVLPYEEYVYLAIGIGMIIGLLFSESLGVMGGGIIVPGYFALHLQDLNSVFITFFIAILTYFFIILLSKYLLVYGRRRVILSLLVAFLIGLFFREYIHLQYIGFIIPGLVASWMDKQGISRTISAILIQSSIVHFILMLIFKYSGYNV